jgi:hypothetical protein
MINFSRFIWNPNLLILLSIILLYLMVKLDKKIQITYLFLSGLILGIGLGCHYQNLILLILYISWFVFLKRVSLKKVAVFLKGLIAGLAPLIIFELRHNFYNLNTIYEIIAYGSTKNLASFPPYYYFLSLMPFIFVFLARFLVKIDKVIPYFSYLFIALIFLHTFYKIFFITDSAFGMPDGWNLKDEQKTVSIILKQNLPNYNIASLLSGDTRSYPTRYLLAINNNPPLNETTYPQADYLFVLSPESIKEIADNEIWEISSFCPCEQVKKWVINNKVKLYLLKKVIK